MKKREDSLNEYCKLVNKVKKHTGIDAISVSVLPGELIVDDANGPICLCRVVNDYNAPLALTGSLEAVGLDCRDLESIGVLEPLYTVPDDYITRRSIPEEVDAPELEYYDYDEGHGGLDHVVFGLLALAAVSACISVWFDHV